LTLSVSYSESDFDHVKSELMGTWQCQYKIISSFTDIITITEVRKNGKVSGLDEWGNPLHGWAKNDLVFITEVEADLFHNSWFFAFKGKKFGQHMSMYSYASDFTADWEKMKVKKISEKEIMSSLYPTREASDFAKLQEARQARLKTKIER